jgi:hypothetical protein
MVIVLVVAWGITAIVGNTFQCWPVQYYWIKHIQGDCMSGQNTFFIIIGSVSLAQDVLILCLPLPIVWKLQTPLRQKIEITLLFSIGCMYAKNPKQSKTRVLIVYRVCIFSVFRLIALREFQTENLTGGLFFPTERHPIAELVIFP